MCIGHLIGIFAVANGTEGFCGPGAVQMRRGRGLCEGLVPLHLPVVVPHRTCDGFRSGGDVAYMVPTDHSMSGEVSGAVCAAVDGGLISDHVKDDLHVDARRHCLVGWDRTNVGCAGMLRVIGALAVELAGHHDCEQSVGHPIGLAPWIGLADRHRQLLEARHDHGGLFGARDRIDGGHSVLDVVRPHAALVLRVFPIVPDEVRVTAKYRGVDHVSHAVLRPRSGSLQVAGYLVVDAGHER